MRAPHRITVPTGQRDIRVTLRIVDDGSDTEPTETIVLNSVQNGRLGAQGVTLRISPCGADRPTSFAWMSVNGEQNTPGKRHTRANDPIRSPFTLRVCFAEPVSGMTIPVRNPDGSIGSYTRSGQPAALEIIPVDIIHPAEIRPDLSEGTLSNLRERVPGTDLDGNRHRHPGRDR